ncbi:MAG: two-component regulator propeller domain-containing protein [Ignavibacteria bacterium]|nr:two-component regulator propeller domain-containing protein [Ignavibacteria bacterium]
MEDSKGYIWLGNKNGLNLYDRGSDTFTRFYFHIEDSGKLSGIPIISIYEDIDKNLWLGSHRGIFKIRAEEYRSTFNSVKNDTSDLNKAYHIKLELINLPGEYIRSVYVDKGRTLWAGTFGSGLRRFNKIKNNFGKKPPNLSADSYPGLGYFIASIYEDTRNNFWIAAYDSGLSVFDRQSETFTRQIDDPVMTMYEDGSGIIWIGTYTSGVKFFDSRRNRFNHYYDDKNIDPDIKGSNLITSIVEGFDGKLWVGTYNNGLKVYSPLIGDKNKSRKKVTVFRFDPNNSYSISSDKVTSLCESEDGSIWIGTENDGLNRYNKNTGRFIRYRNDPKNLNSISSNQITSLVYDDEENSLWIGFLHGNIDKLNLSTNLYTHYRAKTDHTPSLSINSIIVIYRAKRSGLLVGTFEGELNRFNPDNNSFDRINFMPQVGTGKVKNGIFSIYEDSDGILWIGTYGGGLSRFDPKKDSVKTYTELDGLPNDVVYGILPDRAGNLWLSTNKGISRFNPKKGTFRNFDVRDGLQSNEFNQSAFFGSPGGELFFGGVNGFNAFLPEEIKENNFIPPVYITNFKVFDKILSVPYPLTNDSDPIELSYSENFFSFEFVSLNYTAPEKNKYAYMLEGFDKNWHTVASSQRYASYTNLDPGKYVLRVKGSNNDGIWNEAGTSVIILIEPPFWMTLWFQGLIFLFAIVTIGATVRHFVRKKIKEKIHIMEKETALERERLRIARDMHDDLGVRLTEIRFLTEMEQNNSADKNGNVLGKISDLTKDIITTFSEIVWSVNPQNDTLENLAEFIGQFAVDYLSKAQIRCRLDIPSEIPKVQAPAEVRHNVFLAVKEALNNTVKYSDSQEVHIKVWIKETSATVTIHDYGKGFDLAEGNRFGNGLKNMKSRMEHIGGKFNIESQIGTGTIITFQFPILSS